jgi:hypothetical protein
MTYQRARQAGLLSNLLAIALLTLPLPTHAISAERRRSPSWGATITQTPRFAAALRSLILPNDHYQDL